MFQAEEKWTDIHTMLQHAEQIRMTVLWKLSIWVGLHLLSLVYKCSSQWNAAGRQRCSV